MMKRRLLLLALLVSFISTQAQTYHFSRSSSAYSNLSHSISLNNGEVWDDPSYVIPIGFDFQYLGTTTNQLYMSDIGYGAALTPDTNTDNQTWLIPFGIDVIDRGYLSFSKVSLSNISYQLDGAPGGRILKIEWKNAGIYEEYHSDKVSTDYVNFQLWLYEGTNDIEVHFGPSSISTWFSSYGNGVGPFTSLIPNYNVNEEEPTETWMTMSGGPLYPSLTETSTLDEVKYVNEEVPEGMVYKFSAFSNSSEQTSDPVEVSTYPNPVKDVLDISFKDAQQTLQGTRFFDISGQLVKETEPNLSTINVSDLSPGVYFLEIESASGIVVTKRLIKN